MVPLMTAVFIVLIQILVTNCLTNKRNQHCGYYII